VYFRWTRFKNKKVVVKKIGKNKRKVIYKQYDSKPLWKYRIIKESLSQRRNKSYSISLIDDGFTVYKKNHLLEINIQSIKIYKLK
jgi:hypothetical protein